MIDFQENRLFRPIDRSYFQIDYNRTITKQSEAKQAANMAIKAKEKPHNSTTFFL